MKKYMLFLMLYAVNTGMEAQTNTFPPSGSVGIGTLSPLETLHVSGTATIDANIGVPNQSYWLTGAHTLELQNTDGGDVVLSFHRQGYTNAAIKHTAATGLIFSASGSHTDNSMFLSQTGNLGIGTMAPSGKLHISSGTIGDAVFRLEADTNNDNELNNPILEFRQDGGIVGANVGFSENFGENLFGIGIVNRGLSGGLTWDAVVINTADGNVGIGTNTINAFKLSVNGKIRAKEIKVEANWADYVFEDGYPLPSLQQVKKHIQEKGHLINIPSAKEVEENGIALGEMNKRLLEKIEELTLYTLQQEEKLQLQKEANKKLEKRLSLLETQLQKLINIKTHTN